MTRADITKALDEEILRLQQAKQLLEGIRPLTPELDRLTSRNRSKYPPAKHTHVMSAEGRRRIVEAQKRRWAKIKGL